MSLLQRLLLLPLLSPMLALLLLAAVNPRPWVPLRLLTWTSPAWPLGAWIGAAAAAGAGLSAAATGLALQGAAQTLERRQVRRRPADDWSASAEVNEPQTRTAPPRQRQSAETSESPAWGGWSGWAGPTRAAAEPAPTVSVPFRVIRKGRPQASAGVATSASAASPATTSQTPGGSSADDWTTPTSDDW